MWFADVQMQKTEPENRRSGHLTDWNTRGLGLRFALQGPSSVLATKEGGKEWIPSAVVLHAIPLSRMLK